MRIYNNPAAFNTWRQLTITDSNLSKNLEKLSSGMRINRAADDASGLATSEKMRNQISGLRQASTNAQDGISMIQAADGALDVISEMFRRVRTLAVKANNDSNVGEERFYIALEIDQLFDEFKSIVGSEKVDGEEDTYIRGRAEFNTRALFAKGGGFVEDDGASFELLQFQIGANTGQYMNLNRVNGGTNDEGTLDDNSFLQFMTVMRGIVDGELELPDGVGGEALRFQGTLAQNAVDDDGVGWGGEDNSDGMVVALPGEDKENAIFSQLIQEMDYFVGVTNSLRATLGAYQNRLEYTVRNLNTITENTMIAESRIRDTDMVEEMSNFTRNNILLQSGTAMMAQANAKPQTVLRLLG